MYGVLELRLLHGVRRRSVPFRGRNGAQMHCVSSNVVPCPGPSRGIHRGSALHKQTGRKETDLRFTERSLIICLTASHIVSWKTLRYLVRHFGPATLNIALFLHSPLTLFCFTLDPWLRLRSDFCFHDALLTNKPNLLISIFPSSPVGALCRELKGKARQTANKKP